MLGYRIIRVIVWVAAAMFLIALSLRDLQLDQIIVAEARWDRATAYLSQIGPRARVAVDATDPAWVVLTGEPAYVELRVPRWFRRATVEIAYVNHRANVVRVGVRTHPTEWRYDVKTVEGGEVNGQLLAQHPDVTVERTGTITTARIPLTLDRRWQVSRNTYQIILSVPGLSAERPVSLQSLRITAERDPVCVGAWCL